ncbi:MAG: hypothetical protein V1706_11480 [Pseudomonadota bacterium]
MNRILYFALLVAVAATSAGCVNRVVELKPTGPEGKHLYKIAALGFSRDILDDAMRNAGDFCKERDKEFKFVKSVFSQDAVAEVDLLSVDLFFNCLEKQPVAAISPETGAADEKRSIKPKTASVPGSARGNGDNITGDSPGEEEALGDTADLAAEEMESATQVGEITEEVLEK